MWVLVDSRSEEPFGPVLVAEAHSDEVVLAVFVLVLHGLGVVFPGFLVFFFLGTLLFLCVRF